MTQAVPPLGFDQLPHLQKGIEGRIFAVLRCIYEYVVFYGLWSVFGLSSLLWSLPAAILYPLLPKKIGEALGQFMIMAGFRYFVGAMRITGIIKCDLTDLDVLRNEASMVIAPNHPSLLDAVLIISRLSNVVCIAKPEIWDNWFLGAGARIAGFLRNDSPIRLIKQAAERTRAGRHLLIFPEGTRTLLGPVNNFKGGFALIAKKADVPIQTVFIESSSQFLGKSWPLLKKPQFPLHYRVRLGRRFDVGDDVKAFIADLEDYYRDELSDRTPSF
jgi:1-acyl-sn-glycerol-3-phosphate acyltransferase